MRRTGRLARTASGTTANRRYAAQPIQGRSMIGRIQSHERPLCTTCAAQPSCTRSVTIPTPYKGNTLGLLLPLTLYRLPPIGGLVPQFLHGFPGAARGGERRLVAPVEENDDAGKPVCVPILGRCAADAEEHVGA